MKQKESNPPNGSRARMSRLLKDWRGRNHLPLKKIAADLGVTGATWSRWESGDRFPEPDQIRALADYIGVPVCRFFCDDDWQCPGCVRRQR
ncbi:MAG: helix-turn-helix transcriptional regulator [Verrucomicrobia bacterium]|nr:helix-turn-helix transcriptional regulator [Verrucomicrobiota bacterium]